MGMMVNTDKTKAMTINFQNITYYNFMYHNNNLKYKYLEVYLHQKINWNYSIDKMINQGWKA